MAIQFSNLASTTLASGVSSSATSVSVTSASLFPSLGGSDYFYATLGDDAGSEIVKVTAISGTTFTVVRGQDGTSAISHSAGTHFALRVTAAALEDLRDSPNVESVSKSGDTMTGGLLGTTANFSGSVTAASVVVSGTVDGRDVATDGTKLDGVETSADVTDTANVTSSGALMDSELTSIASVKALNQGVASGDSPTFAAVTSTGKLSVSQNAAGFTGSLINTNSASDANGLIIQSGTQYSEYALKVTNTSGNTPFMQIRGDGAVQIPNGGLMIGATTAPSAPLQVSAAPSNTVGAVGISLKDSGNAIEFGLRLDATSKDLHLDRYYSGGWLETMSWDRSTGNVGIGESDPDSTLTVKGASHTNFQVKSNSESTKAFIQTVQDSDVRIGSSTNHPVAFYQNGVERMRTDSDGVTIKSGKELRVNRTDNARDIRLFCDNSYGTLETTHDPLRIKSANAIRFDTGGNDQRATVLANGDFLMGNTVVNPASGFSTQSGFGFDYDTGIVEIATTANAQVMVLGKNNANDGSLLDFRKQGTVIGSIGTQGGDLNIGTGACGIAFVDGVPALYPWTTTGNTTRDAAIDLGDSGARFKDLYLSGTANVGVSRITGQNLAHSASTLVIGHEGSSKSQLRAYGANSSTTGSLEFMVSASDGSGSHSMTIDSSGNVGIGCTPVSKLHVSGNITIDNSSNAPYLDFVENGDTGDSKARIAMDQISGTAGQMLFYTEGSGTLSERMRIDSSGNVGINESVPLGRLHVKTADSGATVDASADELVIEGSGNAGMSILSGASSTGSIYFGDSGTNWDGYIAYSQSTRSMTVGVAAGNHVATFDTNGLALKTDDARLLLEEADGTDIAFVGDLTGAGQGGAFYYNHGGTAVIQLKSYEASTIGVGLKVQATHTSTDVTAADSNTTLLVGNSGTGNGVYNAIRFSGNQQDMYMMSVNHQTEASRRLGFFVGSVAGDAVADEKLSIMGNGYAHLAGAADVRFTLGSQGTAGNNDSNWIRGNGTNLSYNSAGAEHRWEQGGTERMRLDTDGRLAINNNTTAADADIPDDIKLVVAGGTIVGSAATNNNSFLGYRDIGGLTVLQASGNYGLRIFDDNSTTARFTVERGGNVGIGCTPSAKLHINGVDDAGATDLLRLQFDNSPADTGITFTDLDQTVKNRISMDAANTNNMQLSTSSAFEVYTGTTGSGANNLRLQINSAGDLIKAGGVIKGERGTAAAPPYTFSDDTDTGMFNISNADLGFSVGGTERLRIDSSGRLLLNTQTAGGVGYSLYPQTNGALIIQNQNYGNGFTHNLFQYNGTTAGAIVGNISSTAYNTSSDYRLKENVVPMTGSIDRVKALKPSRFNFIIDADKTVDGFLAHEAQEVVPECVTGTKDAMRDEEYEVTAAVEEVRDADDNITTEAVEAVMGTRSVPDYQGIDQAKLVPLLTAALQEAITQIESLTARIAALEE